MPVSGVGVPGPAELGDHLRVQPGGQVPGAVGRGEDRGGGVDVFSAGQQAEPGAVPFGDAVQRRDRVGTERAGFAKASVRLPVQHGPVQRGEFGIGVVAEAQSRSQRRNAASAPRWSSARGVRGRPRRPGR